MLFAPILIPLIVGLLLAVTMGGSGTAPSFSAAYGANIIRKFAIPGLFGSFVFLGAIISGKQVAITLGKELIPADTLSVAMVTIVLLSVALSLLMANLIGVPQSTSQSTVAAISGPAIYLDSLNTDKLFLEVIPAWFILPLISFFLVLLISRILKLYSDKRNLVDFEHLTTHPMLRMLVILSACYVAYAIGSNNVANASGPLASMVMNVLKIDINDEARFNVIVIICTLLIAPGFAIGSSVFGRKILENTGKGIIEFGPLGATIISVVTASLLLLASVTKGIPTSLVQLNAFAIIALGISKKGWKKMYLHENVKKFWIIWISAPLIALAISLFLTYMADNAGILFQ